MNNPKDMLVSTGLERNGVFKGADGLSGLANADAFWEGQPYGTRLYFGDGVADYLHRDVLRAALKSLAELTKLRSERDELLAKVKEAQAEWKFWHAQATAPRNDAQF